MKVYIPFKPRFLIPMVEGTKTQTARAKVYGHVGDWFNAFDHCFVITSTVKQTLGDIADHWKEEGCSSREDFIQLWKTIHPLRDLDFEERFWVHQFKDITKKSVVPKNKETKE